MSKLIVRTTALALLLSAAFAAQAAPNKYDFTGKPAAGYTAVTGATTYNTAQGYGYEAPATEGKPAYFTVDLPEGNYNVTVTLGGAAASTTTIKSEVRRLMLENVAVPAGATETRTFTVNVRTPRIPAGDKLKAGKVDLKVPRETLEEAWNWDKRLTLEFNGSAPAIRSIEIAPVSGPTLFLLGDSTVSDQPGEPYASWGQMMPRFFKPGIAVANHAQSGETYRASLQRRRIDKILSAMKPGDTVLMQFGHNDQKQIKDNKGGPFTTYKDEIKQHVEMVRAHGGIPVILSPMERRRFDDKGKAGITLQDYADAARQSAQELNVPFIDLHAMSIPLYETLGVEGSVKAFAHPPGKQLDNTHHSNYGAYLLAQAVATGMRQANLAAASWIADGYGNFDPKRPLPFAQFGVPASPTFSNERPLGDEGNQ